MAVVSIEVDVGIGSFTVSVKTPSYTREMAQCTQQKP
jgi:hypothetical protein